MSEKDLAEFINAIQKIAHAICPPTTPDSMTQDAAGGSVGSLTEAIMGVTAGLFAIAESIESLSQSVDSLESR